MKNTNERLATFKINDKKWNKFKIKARKAGKTATDVLLLFVDNYLESDIDEIESIDIEDTSVIDKLKKKLALQSLKDDLTHENRDYVESVIQGLTERLNAFDERLGTIEVAIAMKTPPITEPEEKSEAIVTPPEKTKAGATDVSKSLVSKDEGLTYQELAAKEGLNKSTVRGWRDRKRIPDKGDNAKYSKLYEIRGGKFYPKQITPRKAPLKSKKRRVKIPK